MKILKKVQMSELLMKMEIIKIGKAKFKSEYFFDLFNFTHYCHNYWKYFV